MCITVVQMPKFTTIEQRFNWHTVNIDPARAEKLFFIISTFAKYIRTCVVSNLPRVRYPDTVGLFY
jgi:hypothetical protein